MNWNFRIGVVLGVSLLASACAYDGNIGNPLVRKASWFSFLDGADLRDSCQAGHNRLRFVYNGQYNEQVRVYEVDQLPGDEYRVSTRILEPLNLLQLTVSVDDPFAAFRGKESETRINSDDWTELAQAVASERSAYPVPDELKLHSNHFYWVVSGCVDGGSYFHAWRHPEVDVLGLSFAGELLRYDGSGIAPTIPYKLRPSETAAFVARQGDRDESEIRFALRATPDGIR